MNSTIKKLDLIKFNLTDSMALELIKFNEIKSELYKLKELNNLDKNEDLILKIQSLENKLMNSRNKFIMEFRSNNKKEIIEYLNIKKEN